MRFSILKHNPIALGLFNFLLDRQTRHVEGYIFVATTGRSGSSSLSEISKAVDRAVCHHEPHPIMLNSVPPNTDPDAYFYKLFQLKKIYIKRAASRHRYYIETNHQFIKRFANYAVDAFREKIKIIHLQRDPASVATSFYRINSTPGETRLGNLYLLDPGAEDNLLQINDLLSSRPEFKHDMYKCLWYWYETEARIRQFRINNPEIPFFKLSTSGLNDYNTLATMFETLNVEFDEKILARLVGTKDNTKVHEKKKSLDINEGNEMNEKLLHELEKRYPEIIEEIRFNNAK